MKYNDCAIERLEDRLLELFAKKSTPQKYSVAMLEAAEVIRQLKKQVAPPPNDPLTLEELREMDGMPVWVVTGSAINAGRGCWDICDWRDKNTVMLPYGGEQPRLDDYSITWLAYRRKPKGENHDKPTDNCRRGGRRP